MPVFQLNSHVLCFTCTSGNFMCLFVFVVPHSHSPPPPPVSQQALLELQLPRNESLRVRTARKESAGGGLLLPPPPSTTLTGSPSITALLSPTSNKKAGRCVCVCMPCMTVRFNYMCTSLSFSLVLSNVAKTLPHCPTAFQRPSAPPLHP